MSLNRFGYATFVSILLALCVPTMLSGQSGMDIVARGVLFEVSVASSIGHGYLEQVIDDGGAAALSEEGNITALLMLGIRRSPSLDQAAMAELDSVISHARDSGGPLDGFREIQLASSFRLISVLHEDYLSVQELIVKNERFDCLGAILDGPLGGRLFRVGGKVGSRGDYYADRIIISQIGLYWTREAGHAPWQWRLVEAGETLADLSKYDWGD